MQIADVFPQVRDAIARCCSLDPDTILLESRLIPDLGMESLDIVELIYEIEQAFAITVPMTGIDQLIEETMGGEPFEVDGVLTTAAVARLRESVDGLSGLDAAAEIAPHQVPLFLTVHSVCGLIIREKAKATPAPAGG